VAGLQIIRYQIEKIFSSMHILAQTKGCLLNLKVFFFIFKPSFHHPPYIGKQLSLTTGFTLSNQTFIQW
jgi:hypothetical protein